MLKALIQPVTLFEQNASIIFCDETKKCAIVDPGGDLEILLNIAKEKELSPGFITSLWRRPHFLVGSKK